MSLTSIQDVYEALQQTTTQSGLRVVCELAKKIYVAGIKASPEFLATEPTKRDAKLHQYNYKFSLN